MSLFWRVFTANAALLVAAAVVLGVTPVTVSWPIAVTEAVVLGLGLAGMLAVNTVLLRLAFAPLTALTTRMRQDPQTRRRPRRHLDRTIRTRNFRSYSPTLAFPSAGSVDQIAAPPGAVDQSIPRPGCVEWRGSPSAAAPPRRPGCGWHRSISVREVG